FAHRFSPKPFQSTDPAGDQGFKLSYSLVGSGEANIPDELAHRTDDLIQVCWSDVTIQFLSKPSHYFLDLLGSSGSQGLKFLFRFELRHVIGCQLLHVLLGMLAVGEHHHLLFAAVDHHRFSGKNSKGSFALIDLSGRRVNGQDKLSCRVLSTRAGKADVEG